jgi:glutamine synthetase
MAGNAVRRHAIEALATFTPPPAIFSLDEEPGGIFGENVFGKAVMQKVLPTAVFKSVLATLEKNQPLAPDIADAVAVAMKDWAMSRDALRARVLPAHRLDR